MTEAAVSVQNISKLYLLYNKPQDRLKQSILGRLGKNYAHTFWALRDITFKVQRGEVLGIIGRNGSGKSTLLQIIAGILQPTVGQLDIRGRLTALLELGAGFNPEFTGRENILLNGATIGISEKEMLSRMDEIIDFAQIGEFIDQPVKIYSSGMYVRLAFAIATSVKPDILIIDEALSVGDAGFVIKCTNRMKQMRDSGATILLVTHDVQYVRSFCERVVWLENGSLKQIGLPIDITSQYIQCLFNNQLSGSHGINEFNENTEIQNKLTKIAREKVDLTQVPYLVRWGTGGIRFESIILRSKDSSSKYSFNHGDKISITVTAKAMEDINSHRIGIGIAFRNKYGLDIITSTTIDQNQTIPPLKKEEILEVDFEFVNILANGDYAVVLNIEDRTEGIPTYFDFIENATLFRVIADINIYSLVLPKVEQSIRLNKYTLL